MSKKRDLGYVFVEVVNHNGFRRLRMRTSQNYKPAKGPNVVARSFLSLDTLGRVRLDGGMFVGSDSPLIFDAEPR